MSAEIATSFEQAFYLIRTIEQDSNEPQNSRLVRLRPGA